MIAVKYHGIKNDASYWNVFVAYSIALSFVIKVGELEF